MKRGKNLKWHLAVVVLATFIFAQTPVALLNSTRFQQWFLRNYKPFSPWIVSFESLKFQPWRLKFNVSKLKFSHPEGHQIAIDSIFLKLRTLRLLRAQVAVDQLSIESPSLFIAKSLTPKEKKPKKRFKLRTLLLLQNLLIYNGTIKNFKMDLPGAKTLTVDLFGLKFKPSLLGGTNLGIDFNNVQFQGPIGQKKKAKNLKVSVTTNFRNWSKTFPYIDDVDGNFLLQKTDLGRLQLDEVEAKLQFVNGKLRSKKFSIQVGENFLTGDLDAEIPTEKFSLNLDIPKPLYLPELSSEIRTFNSAGKLTANLELDGQGFDFKTTNAKGLVKVNNLFENIEDYPVDVLARFDVAKGIVQLKEGKVTTDNASIDVAGSIDLSSPSLHLNLKTQDFPLERFFDKFLDKNLHPIHGKGNAQGTLNGLGKTIHLQLTADATEGGYGLVKAEKAAITLDINYDRLKLDGKIFAEERPTGDAQLIINYGPKILGQARPKKISFMGKINNQPLESTLPGFHLKGAADGEITLSGSPLNIQGKGTINASQGSFFDEGFENIKTHFTLSNKKMVVDQADFVFSNLTTSFIKPLTFDFIPSGFKLWGQPLAGVNVDVNYSGENKRWQINKLTIQDPDNSNFKSQASGTISPTDMNLKGAGDIELSRLKFLTKHIREAEGPAQFQLSVNGTYPNLGIHGKINFNSNVVSLRKLPLAAEELKGTLNFQGNRIQTDGLTGIIGVGNFQLKGWMTHSQGKPSAFDAKLIGNQLYFRNEQGDFRMEYDADLAIRGAAQNPEVSGSLIILDGRYTKDFNIIEELQKTPRTVKEFQQAALKEWPLRFNVSIKNLGDLLIDNNVGRIELSTNLQAQGTSIAPRFQGSVGVSEGIIHYLGLDFDITKGFLEFREAYSAPYLEVDAEKEVDDAHVRVKLHGRTDNLAIDLSGNSTREGALEKKDVISLILFGVTNSERLRRGSYFEQELGPQVVAEQITHALQRPFAKATRLDIFRLESKPTQDGRIQQFHVGKRLSDRLSVEFASEISRQNALQTFRMEYWLTDFLLIKGARTTDESYQLNMGLRFKSR